MKMLLEFTMWMGKVREERGKFMRRKSSSGEGKVGAKFSSWEILEGNSVKWESYVNGKQQ